jgi:transglutaminase-like putative cysteine protease
MTFDTFFRASSYAMVACGALALAVSGGMGPTVGAAFLAALALAWALEGRRWQLSERVGLVVVLLSLPLFYLDWRFLEGLGYPKERVGASALAHLTLFLSAVKLLQTKADRDWIFLYLISFFEVLLAAGLSVSPVFLAALGLYVLCSLCTVLSFEIRKSRRGLQITETRLLVAPDSTLFRRLRRRRASARGHGEARRLPVVALGLLALIFALALPLFFVVPRYGSSALARSNAGASHLIGFSDSVTLGDIGRLQQSNGVVMRVRVDDPAAARNRSLRWRGVALDEFNGRGWRRSKVSGQYLQSNNDRNFFQLGTTEGLQRVTTQTFFLEPLDTPVLFAAPRAVAIQGGLPFVRVDREGALQTRGHTQERITYRAYSDTTEPDAESLRKGSAITEPQLITADTSRYLQLPRTLDPRIPALARDVVKRSGARNRYDAARALEAYLQNDFGYTLEMKAGGQDPLADFLFRVREGHCEYFSTTLAVMLRTQGIPARVVNGFQTGEYNDAANVYTVTQSDAHSWVEAYFPDADAWVTLDPTPASGRPVRESAGLRSRLGKYAEALDLFWAQYVVGYDRQEQRSLASAAGSGLVALRRWLAGAGDELVATTSKWSLAALGQYAPQGPSSALLLAALLLLLVLSATVSVSALRKIRKGGFRRGLKFWRSERPRASVVQFYERMTRLLTERGLRREPYQTPLEFAAATGMPEAVKITRAYNRIRFGDEHLSASESAEVERWLRQMEGDVSDE